MMLRLGVIGHPIKHSISPIFQQAALDACGVNARYEAYEVPPEGLASFLEDVARADWLGVNVTIPHKRAALALMNEITPESRSTGAVNTVVSNGGSLLGTNTDTSGFLRALEEAGHSVGDERAVVLGSGGAARAVVAGLCEAGAESVVLFSRSLDRARILVADLQAECSTTTLVAAPWVEEVSPSALRDATLLVNATPVGMLGGGAEGRSPVPATVLHSELTVFDTMYNPLDTPLLRHARRARARTASGLDMLVHQGAESFELWTGITAPLEIMRARAREALES